jgi:hypothetical protein
LGRNICPKPNPTATLSMGWVGLSYVGFAQLDDHSSFVFTHINSRVLIEL